MSDNEIFGDTSSALAELGIHHGYDDFQGLWEEKRPWNTPGPLYTASVDNSGPGPAEAPNNIYIDADGFPFVFRQPTTRYELRQVVLAANDDPFSGYGADGNQHWTSSSIRTWWQERQTMEAYISAARNEVLRSVERSPWYLAAIERWREYVQTDMERYLRVYAFFLDEGHVPTADDPLPTLS